MSTEIPKCDHDYGSVGLFWDEVDHLGIWSSLWIKGRFYVWMGLSVYRVYVSVNLWGYFGMGQLFRKVPTDTTSPFPCRNLQKKCSRDVIARCPNAPPDKPILSDAFRCFPEPVADHSNRQNSAPLRSRRDDSQATSACAWSGSRRRRVGVHARS
jgi:hypothetical protein